MTATDPTAPAAPPPAEPADHELATLSAALILTRITELVGLVRGNVLNHVLYAGSVVLDDNGVAELGTAVNFATVAVRDTGGDGLTVTTEPLRESAPGSGTGVILVTDFLCWPLVGTVLTIYGTPGTVVNVALYADPQPPSSGSGSWNGGSP